MKIPRMPWQKDQEEFEMPQDVAEFTRLADPTWYVAWPYVCEAYGLLRKGGRSHSQASDEIAAMAAVLSEDDAT